MASIPLDHSGGGDVGDLRQCLSQLLDDACQFLCKSTAISKQFQDDTIEHKLLIKQEQARQQCKAVVERLESQLPVLQRKMEAEVTEAIIKKEKQLRQEYDHILDAMKQVVKDCNIIESMLEEADSDQLLADAPQLINHLRKTMAYNPEDNFTSVLSLEYIPDFDKINNWFQDTSQFGYIKSSLFEVSQVKLVNWQNNAYKDNEDILCLKISQHHVKMCKEFVHSFIMTPAGSELPVSIEDNQDGTMTLKYTPEEKGVHYLHVRMYNAHISGSPFRIDVKDVESPNAEPQSLTSDAKKKQVNRSFLCELTRHITEQPPPKQYRRMQNPEAEKKPRDRSHSPYRDREKTTKSDTDSSSRSGWERERQARTHSKVPSRSDVKSWRSRDDGPGEAEKQDQNNNMAQMNEERAEKPWSRGRGVLRRNEGAVENSREDMSTGRQATPWPKKNEQTQWSMPRHSTVDESTFLNGDSDRSQNLAASDGSASARGHNEPVKHSYTSSALRFEPSIDTPEPETIRSQSESNIHQLPHPSTLATKLSQQESRNVSSKFMLSPTAMARRSSAHESLDSEFGSQASDDVHYAPLAVVEPEPLPDSLESKMVDLNLYDPTREDSCDTLPRDSATSDGIPMRSDQESGFESSAVESNVFEPEPEAEPEPVKVKQEHTIKREEFGKSYMEPVSNVPVKKEPMATTKATTRKKSRWSPLTEDKDTVQKDTVQAETIETETIETKAVAIHKEPPRVKTPLLARPLDELSTYPALWIGTGRTSDMLYKYLSRGDIVEGLSTHPHVQVIGGPRSSDIKFPIGVTVNRLTNDIIVCNQGADTVKIFDWNGKPKCTLGDGKDGVRFFRPSAVVTDYEGNIYVKDNKVIARFDQDGKHVMSFGKEVLNVPYGLALTPCGRLLTLNPRRRAIVLFARDGSEHETHEFSPTPPPWNPHHPPPPPPTDHRSGAPPSSKLRFLAVHGSKLVVCDLGLSVFYVTSIHGGAYEMFGTWGRGYGQFNEPSGVTMDRFGNMLIADSKNDRIHVYDPAGNFSGFVNLSERIRRPSDIHLTQDGGHLLVSNLLGHSVSIFKLVA